MARIIQRFHRQARSQCLRRFPIQDKFHSEQTVFNDVPVVISDKQATIFTDSGVRGSYEFLSHYQDLDVVGTSYGNRHKGTNSMHGSREIILIYC